MLLTALALIAATPATLPTVLAAAKGGDQIKLAPGDYGQVTLERRIFKPPLTLDATSGATLTGLDILGSDGIALVGGKLSVGNVRGYTILIRQSRNVSISKAVMSDAKRGIVIDRSQDVAIVGNTLKELTIDGVNIALSQRVLIEDNDCTSFSTGKAHPDCFQAWSRPGGITSDVTIRNNRATGNIQGITFFNHKDRGKTDTSPGVDDGGFDRITITGNVVKNLYPQAIHAADVRGLVLRDNQVSSLPGARFKSAINVNRSVGEVCNNQVPDVSGSPATVKCR